MKLIGMIAIGMACAAGHADVYSWQWQPGEGIGHSDSGGEFGSVKARYDSVSEVLTWEVNFLNQITDGFTLAINDGPNPKGHAGELGLLYFDATDTQNVRVSTYAYNGMNTQTSYRDGSPLSGTQEADVIFGVTPIEGVASSVLQASVNDTATGRSMRLVLDASAINAHTPVYPGPQGVDEWFGMGFDSLLGVWFHPVTSLVTEYDEDGALSFWSGRQGWLDGSGFQTSVPAPGVAAVGLCAAGMIGRRRR